MLHNLQNHDFVNTSARAIINNQGYKGKAVYLAVPTKNNLYENVGNHYSINKTADGKLELK